MIDINTDRNTLTNSCRVARYNDRSKGETLQELIER